MKALLFISAIAMILCLSHCSDLALEPLTENSQKPRALTNITVESVHGGAIITYTLPDDPNLLYVMAEFSSGEDGALRVVKSSVFKNSLTLDGFKSTDEQTVRLYTVNRSEVRSDPMEVSIKPLISPIEVAFQTLVATHDFGGVNVQFANEMGNEYVLYILTKDAENNWNVYDRLYTMEKNPNYTFRGLAAEPQDFAFYFQDKWQNTSDTLFQNLTPLYEEELDKSLWRHYLLDNDNYYPLYPDRPASNLWSKSTANFVMAPYPGIELPVWITIDLGQTAVLGRMKMKAISASTSNYQWFYSTGTPRVFEVWGSNNPTFDGAWDSWTLLDRFESVKPSGLPIGHNAPEDIAAGLAGEDHKFANYENAYRYIRFKVIQTWGSRPDIMLEELTFWGTPVNAE